MTEMRHQIELIVQIRDGGKLDAGIDVTCLSPLNAACRSGLQPNDECRAVEFFGNCEHGARDMYAGNGDDIDDNTEIHVWSSDDGEWHWQTEYEHRQEMAVSYTHA